jgi:hypothetical protein
VRLKIQNYFQTHVQTKMPTKTKGKTIEVESDEENLYDLDEAESGTVNSENEVQEPIVSREEAILNSLLRFYNQDPQHLNILAAISKQKTIISLREMDYTVTNYSNNNKVVYRLKDGTLFNMHLDYKGQLRGYSKRCFDPFCRRQRIFLDFKTKTPEFLNDKDIDKYKLREDGLVTTIGQLAFFRWAILNEVVDFCFNNKENIDEEMETMDKKKKKNKPIKPTKIIKNIAKSNPKNSDTVKVVIQFT